MTTATINGKRTAVSMYDKAALLNVSQVSGEAGYVVSSGSDSHKSYRVSADCHTCNCDAYGLCSHRIAAKSFQQSQQPRRAATCDYCGGYHNSSNCPF